MSSSSGGRPRDPAIDDAIRAAARELVLEVGYRGVSMDAVAARAGVTKPTLYRRHPSKGALLFDTVFGQTRSRAMPDSGDLRADLVEAYGWAVAEFATPEARAALPGLLAEMASSPELVRLVRENVLDPEIARVHHLLRDARERGAIAEDADLSTAVDTFIGAVLAAATVLNRTLDDDFTRRVVDLVLDGLRPRPPG